MSADDKIITHADLRTLRHLGGVPIPGDWSPEVRHAVEALLHRLRAAAEADAPSLPEGWVVRKNGGAHYHRAGELFLNADCDQRTWSREGLREELHQFTPLRPTVTEADVERAAAAIARAVRDDFVWQTVARAVFEAAGIEVTP